MGDSSLNLKTPIFEWRNRHPEDKCYDDIGPCAQKHRQHSSFNTYQHNWDHFERNEKLPL